MDPYRILGVSADATSDEISAAFKRKLKENKADNERSVLLQARGVLTNVHTVSTHRILSLLYMKYLLRLQRRCYDLYAHAEMYAVRPWLYIGCESAARRPGTLRAAGGWRRSSGIQPVQSLQDEERNYFPKSQVSMYHAI